MKRKIVFVLPQLKTGGGVRVIVELSNVLVQKHGFDVRIVIPNVRTDFSFVLDPSVVVERVGKEATSVWSKIGNIVQMFFYLKKQYKDEVVITTDPIFSPLFLLFRFKKLFRYIQADDYRIFDDLLLLKKRSFLMIYKAITKLSYKQDIIYLFNSRFTHREFVAISGRDVPLRIVHPSINHRYFYTDETADEVEKDQVTICLIARKHPMKRFEDFIAVYQKLKGVPGLREKIAEVFVISHDDLREYDLDGITLVVPKNDQDIASTMRKSDIYLFTSLWEGFGLPPLEAMACGCAVVASDAKGIDEYAIDGENALIYPPADREALYKNLVLLIEDKGLRKRLKNAGRQRAADFSWEKSAAQLIRHIEECEGV